jgi:hypothetical protein
MKAITTQSIDEAFVESHGREVLDILKPTTSSAPSWYAILTSPRSRSRVRWL